MTDKERSYRLSSEAKQDLKAALRARIEGCEDVLFAFLYGSVLDNLPVHDIDVGVYVGGIPEDAVTGRAIDIASKLQSATKVPVDVRIVNFAPVPFQYKVLRGELLLERDEVARAGFAEKVMGRYFDMEPLLRRGCKEAFAA